MTVQELTEQIRLAFPPQTFDGEITRCNCDECSEIREELRNKRWDELPPSFLDRTASTLLLTIEAVHAFLPAYLLRALDDLISSRIVQEFTVYSLCPPYPDEDNQRVWRERRMCKLLEITQLMNPAQVQVIRAFLTFIQEHAEDGEWFQPIIADALENIWR